MIFRARCIYPVSQPPIEDGAFEVQDEQVVKIARWNDFAKDPGDVRDLGEVVIMPGLINAHCHLDYTDVAGQIPATRAFPDWVKTMLSFKAHWSYTEYARSWLNGARMSLASGITTVVDTEAVPELLPEVWDSTALRVVSLLEMTGVKSGRAAAHILKEALDKIASLPSNKRCRAGLLPHAPYSTRPELLRMAAAAAWDLKLPLSSHVAESSDEFDMFLRAQGPFYDWLVSQRIVADYGLGSPTQHMARNGMLGPNFIAIHANYLAAGDAELLAESRSSIVHCPKSHEYFAHQQFAYHELADAGVNICLGTDSLATVRRPIGKAPRLNLWDEMKLFAKSFPDVSPAEIVKMVTTNAAQALGRKTELGMLAPGSAADFLIMQSASSTDETQLCGLLISSASVQSVYIGGVERWNASL
jgi:cytosine/adenosine deaminase-related metal-dependent hydrolase